MVEEKVKTGQTETVVQIEDLELGESAKIYDLTEMLQRSLQGRKTAKTSSSKQPVKKAAKPASRRKA